MFSYLMYGNSLRFFKIITCLFPLDGDVKELEKYIFVCLFGLRLAVPVNNVSFMSGRSHCFLGITSIFREVNVSCSRIEKYIGAGCNQLANLL